MAVGAVDQAGDETSFTSFGERVDVYANGFEVESYLPGGEKMSGSGTSMSSPNAANLVAKLFALDPSLTPIEVIDMIKQGADRSEDGRLDYVETARVWLEAVNAPGGLKKWLEWGKFLWKGIRRPELITRYKAVREDAFSRGFAYNIIGHKRLTFQRSS